MVLEYLVLTFLFLDSKIFFFAHRLFHVYRFVTARKGEMVDGWYYTAPVLTLPPRLLGFSDLLGMTFLLWPGSPSASEAKSRQ